MGLIIKPKSKYRALQCHVYRWDSLKKVFRGEPIEIAWDCINSILIYEQNKILHYIIDFKNAEGYQANLSFFVDEIANLPDFENFAKENPDKINSSRLNYFKELVADNMKPYLRYGAVSTKLIIGLLAVSFMYFQLKYFGSLLIQKYQFLIKSSCNEQCAQQLWSISTLWFYVLMMTIAPLIPFLFYKKIYSVVSRSKKVQIINSAMIETALLALAGVMIVISSSPLMIKATTRYSKVIAAYSDGSLQAKLSQKVEMASKRKFQGDIDDESDEDETVEESLEQ